MLGEVDYIITVSDSIKSWYVAHKPGVPVEVIYNSPPLTQNYLPKEYLPNHLTAGYEGTFNNKKRMKDKIVRITELCSKQGSFQFKVIGGNRLGHPFSIPAHLQNKILLTGWVDYEQLPNHLKDVDIGWIDMEQADHSLNRKYAMPNKFFSYLNNGIPVLVNRCYEMERFISKHKCGFVVEKENATSEDYAEAFMHLKKTRKN